MWCLVQWWWWVDDDADHDHDHDDEADVGDDKDDDYDHDHEADDHDEHGDEADVSMNLLLSASWQSSMGPPTDRWEYWGVTELDDDDDDID